MTRSPLLSTLLPLIPLAAMAWPLHQVITQEAYVQEEEIAAEPGPTRRADLEIRSAHPFTKIEVKIDQAIWDFLPGDYEKELYFPLDQSGDLDLTFTATWPEGTPETAVIFELTPDELEMKSHTLWGLENVTEEVKFHWDLTK